MNRLGINLVAYWCNLVVRGCIYHFLDLLYFKMQKKMLKKERWI